LDRGAVGQPGDGLAQGKVGIEPGRAPALGVPLRLAEAVKGATQWVVDHVRVIGLMAAAYAQFKIVGALLQLNAWRAALIATTNAQIANNAAVASGSRGSLRKAST